MSGESPDELRAAQDLSTFLPRLLLRRAAEGSRAEIEPVKETFPAAVLFADISGFTALAETMALRGIGGTEDLTRVLNTHFGALIAEILSAGGDVIKFAGDALLAVWPGTRRELAALTHRAAACGLAAQARFGEVAAATGSGISVRIGVSAGPLTSMVVGGVSGRWEFVVTGQGLVQMAAIAHAAAPRDVVLSPEAWDLVRQAARGEALDGTAVRLLSIQPADPPPPVCEPALPPERVYALRGFVPGAVSTRLETGQVGWMGELRRITVVFVHFPNLGEGTPIDRAQQVMQAVQEVLSGLEGNINKLSADDKGTALLAAFGTPPLAHEDDPVRAVQAALQLVERLRPIDVRISVGITSGRAFCGVIGDAARHEYTVIGDVVNQGARLMQAADGSILCDGATSAAAAGRVTFESLPPILVKGKAERVAVFRPLSVLQTAPVAHSASPLVGREREQSLLAEQVARLAAGRGGVVVVEGAAGIGKSRLLDEFAQKTQVARIPLLRGAALALEGSTPYFAWREVFRRLCDPQGDPAGEAGDDRIAARILQAAGQDAVEWLALLNPVLSTRFPESAGTAPLAGQARAERTHELLVRLLTTLGVGVPSPRALILDDGHWLDSASWALALLVSRKVPSLLLLLATRPMGDAEPAEFREIIAVPSTRRMRLEALPRSDTIRLVCQRLGVTDLPPAVADSIVEKSEGNPLFAEELAHAMRESGRLIAVDGECRLAPQSGPGGLEIPDTVEAAMTARIDRLTPSQQLTLKVASVIGRTFELGLLRRIYPLEEQTGQIDAVVADLAGRDMVARAGARAEAAYVFRHGLLQEVAYNLMLFSQRRQLHRVLAEWLERSFADNLDAWYPRIAHHYSRVVDYGEADPALVATALGYQQKAGEQALRSFANREAASFFAEALRLLRLLPEGSERDRLELTLQLALGPPLIASRGFASEDTAATYARAWDLCGRLGNDSESFDVLSGLWNFHTVATKFDKAGELADELLKLAQAADEPTLLLRAHRAVGENLYWTGYPRPALKHMRRVAKLYRKEHHEPTVTRSGMNPAVVSVGQAAWAWWLLGYPDGAVTTISAQFALAREVKHPFSEAMAYMNAALLYQFRREPKVSREMSEALIALSREEGFALWLAGASIMRGWALSEEGSVAEGIVEARQGIEQWKSTGAELAGPYYRSLLAEAYVHAGRIDEARLQVEQALELAGRSGEVWWLPELLRLQASLLLAASRDNATQAEHGFREAIRLARQRGTRSLELRAACSLGRLLLQQRRPEEAGQAIGPIFESFGEGLDTLDLIEARELLEESARG